MRQAAGAVIDDKGALSLMIVVLFFALVLLAGFVVDGGAKIRGEEYAAALAQEAARAGATTVDASHAYATGSVVVDQPQVQEAVGGYLAEAGIPAADRYSFRAIATASTVRVTVTIAEPTAFLSMIGLDTFTCQGTATASLQAGVTGGT